ncbi:hypothetical protein BV25DRAFT_1917784 [Artomyces pyxidatus]|uniref:Uncharacterized protein n=1 Tax=Artomyces pyxidatus TaxID=48021 RepID=A0ACB8SW65_9AGAM|nr:hypothetical protein BV25DRAFT_1917784 [Artomyces pyxidatus]
MFPARPLLHAALFCFLFANASLAFSNPTTPNDPFYALAIRTPKPPEEPICCLKPLPVDSVDDDLFLSFEDWKSRRSAESSQKDPPGPPPANASSIASGGELSPDVPSSDTNTATTQDVAEGQSSESVSPHFRVPLTDRFNYASLDCSARVHTAHRSAKSTSNILSSKRDRYMLSPCASEKQFIIVELCEDIRIDTVQLANYEFFSGVFKEFTVSVAKTYTEGWTVAGTYMAKNVRGVQSFHPPTSLGDFYRFIRIDFHSHYGSEYYCPISLLRVYGLTHLEQWKWDEWAEESRAKQEQSIPAPVVAPAEVGQEPPKPVQTPEVSKGEATSSADGHPVQTSTEDVRPHAHEKRSTPSEALPGPSRRDEAARRHSTDIARSEPPSSPIASPSEKPLLVLTSSTSSSPTRSDVAQSSAPSSTDISPSVSKAPHASASDTSSNSQPGTESPASHSQPQSNPSSSAVTSQSVSVVSNSSPPVISLAPPAPPSHIPSSGESIYRTIMNRLTALEANTTLYTRYVEEQTAGVREMLRRLSEDVGRLEGIGRAQAHLYQRSVSDFEKQRRRMEVEQRELITQVNYLADEIALEKRLGIAQLFLLLAVLIFLSLTRGSRSEVPLPPSTLRGVPGALSMKEWGRRNLSFSGDWVSRLRSRSRTPSNGETTPVPRTSPRDEHLSTFPTTTTLTSERLPPKRINLTPSHNPNGRRPGPAPRSRTPSIRNTPRSHHNFHPRAGPSTPTSGARPLLQRSNSHNSAGAVGLSTTAGADVLVGPVPRSAKRWAHSAHLHEVRRVGLSASRDRATGLTVDVFGASELPDRLRLLGEGATPGSGERLGGVVYRRRASPLRLSTPSKGGQGDPVDDGADAWVDTDADADGSDVDAVPVVHPEVRDARDNW